MNLAEKLKILLEEEAVKNLKRGVNWHENYALEVKSLTSALYNVIFNYVALNQSQGADIEDAKRDFNNFKQNYTLEELDDLVAHIFNESKKFITEYKFKRKFNPENN